MSLGMEIKVRRVMAGMKQKELAEKLGVSQGKISAYELDMMKPSIKSIVKLSEVFGCTTDDLLKDEIQKSVCSKVTET